MEHRLIVFDLNGTLAMSKSAIDQEIAGLRALLRIGRMIFLGDALFPGGNEYSAKAVGATSIQVRDPEETKRVIATIIACLTYTAGLLPSDKAAR